MMFMAFCSPHVKNKKLITTIRKKHPHHEENLIQST